MAKSAVKTIGKRLAVLLVLAAAAAGGYRYYQTLPKIEESDPGHLVLHGNVDVREADLGFNSTGRVSEMLVEEGDEVRRGQVLASLDSAQQEARVEAARAQVAARQAMLDRLLAGSRPEEIRFARAQMAALKAELADARAQLKRVEKLAANQFASEQTLDSARARVSALVARLDAARQTLSLTVQGPRDEDIAEARATLRGAEADLALAQEQLAQTRLEARDDGVVTTRVVEPGAVVLPNTTVYTVALTSPVWVRTYVAEPDLGRIFSGQSARVFTDSRPDRPYDGQVGYISPVAEFTPKAVETPELRTSLVYRLRVVVRNPDRGLRQGMPVTVRIAVAGGAPASKTSQNNKTN